MSFFRENVRILTKNDSFLSKIKTEQVFLSSFHEFSAYNMTKHARFYFQDQPILPHEEGRQYGSGLVPSS